MEEPTHKQQDKQTDSGSQHGQPTMRLQVPDEAACELGETVVCNSFDVTECALLHLLQSLIPLNEENLDQWTWEERRDYLHWCLDEGVLTIQDGRLVPVEELVPTALLTHDIDLDAHDRAEHAALLCDVERGKPVISSNPSIGTKEWADDLGLNSEVYAYTPNMSMNAHTSAQEGAD
jgi:hypothetical protein